MSVNSRIKDPVADFHRSQAKHISRWHNVSFPDIWLLFALIALVTVGIVMVTSASTPIALQSGAEKLYFVKRQGVFYGASFICAYIAFSQSVNTFFKHADKILILSIIMLFLVFVPGIGYAANGAHRWLNLGPIKLQSGEVAKLAVILYTAAFLTKSRIKLEHSWSPVFLLLLVGAVFSALLLKQPDFGTTAVMLTTLLGMMFLAGIPLGRFLVLGAIAVTAMGFILVAAPYRVKRLITFLDPFKYQYDEGYQLANSLVAIGRGGVHGVGLGDSVFKHQFVPEAHTDFIFSITAEEFGLIGALIVMSIYVLLVWRAFMIGQLADRVRKRFHAYVAYGMGLWIGIQTLINIGVVTGVLPTKGLTLPLISYGGSSLMITGIALGILARIDGEARFQAKREGIL